MTDLFKLTAVGRAIRTVLALGAMITVHACTPTDLRPGGITGTVGSGPPPSMPDWPATDTAGEAFETNGVAYVEARDGDTAETIAARIGVSPTELAQLNGIFPSAPLERGRVLELPGGTATDAPGDAAAPGPFGTVSDGMNRQVRHRVQPGETAFSIARLYNIPARELARWNGLDDDLTVRPNQNLLIPRPPDAAAGEPPLVDADGEEPPPPRSSTKPLPEDIVVVTLPESPNMGQTPTELPARTANEDGVTVVPLDEPVTDRTGETQTAAAGELTFVMPVEGKIVGTYSGVAGGNEGIDIEANAGTSVVAAADGKVVLISRATDQTSIVLLSHPDEYFTVYKPVTDILHEKGTIVKRGQQIGTVPPSDEPQLHFKIRKGTRSVDPMTLLSSPPSSS